MQYGEEAGTLQQKQNGTLMGAAAAAASMSNSAPALSLQTALVKGKVKLALYYKVLIHVYIHGVQICRFRVAW